MTRIGFVMAAIGLSCNGAVDAPSGDAGSEQGAPDAGKEAAPDSGRRGAVRGVVIGAPGVAVERERAGCARTLAGGVAGFQ